MPDRIVHTSSTEQTRHRAALQGIGRIARASSSPVPFTDPVLASAFAVGHCLSCGAVEVSLNQPTSTRDLSVIGESPAYPTGYGCELCD